MLELVAKDYEVAKTTQTAVRIAFPVVVLLLLTALVWLIARRVRRRRQASS